jgi:molybdate transport system substrate-binding protein
MTASMVRLIALLLLLWPLAAVAAPITIAAAADLRGVLPAIIADFRAATGRQVAPVFGASGSLVQQMLNGAPHQLLLAADSDYPARLVAAGKADGAPRPYALGRLALLAQAGSGVTDLESLRRQLAAGRIRHVAIANPAVAPYGRAARAVLDGAGLKPPLVLGENVGQAVQFVASGGAEAGIVSAALARDAVRRGGLVMADLPASAHPPLVQSLVLARGAGADARAFATWMAGPQARRRLAAAGFGLP